MLKQFLLPLLGLAATALADDCRMDGGELPTPMPEPDTNRCTPLPDGMYTFWMEVTLIEIPNPGQPAGTFEPTNAFGISNSTCFNKSVYGWPRCGKPAIIEENFLKDVLIIDTVNMDVGGPYFSFRYGDSTYATDGDHCSCAQEPDGLMAKAACKCIFPWSGEWPQYFVGPEAGVIPPRRARRAADRRRAQLISS